MNSDYDGMITFIFAMVMVAVQLSPLALVVYIETTKTVNACER